MYDSIRCKTGTAKNATNRNRKENQTMAIYQMEKHASPAVITMKFHTFNAAVDFATKSGICKASNPYKGVMYFYGETKVVWCVTLPSPKPDKATFKRIDIGVNQSMQYAA
jgi:hypothetical protein